MRANYEETPPLLGMAQQMCEALQNGIADVNSIDSDLHEQLLTLVRLTYHHRAARALHTNEPQVSLTNFQIFNDMIRAKYGEEVRGDTDQSLGVSWNELGNGVLQNNDSQRAEECFLRSIAALKSLDGATRITISMPLVNLGFAYWVQGKLIQAAEIFRQALKDREDEYGVDDRVSFV